MQVPLQPKLPLSLISILLVVFFYIGTNRYENLAKQLIPFIESQETKAIIYVDFVKDAAPLAISLHQAGYKTCAYHGQKMSTHDKLQSLANWKSGVVKIMVCTTAFGMGIDQPDVDMVVRIGCPPTLESMVQEFGRAGRDGRLAKGSGNTIVIANNIL